MAIRKRAKRIRFVNKILHTQRTLRLSNAILLRNINLTIYGYKTSGADPGRGVHPAHAPPPPPP